MGWFGRKSRAQLEAEARAERERREALEAARRGPTWRRFLRRLPWPVWTVAAPVTVAAVVAVLAGRVTWAAGKRWPRPVTAAALTGWAAAGGPGGWWGILPLSLTTAAATWWHHTLRPAPPRPLFADAWTAKWRTEVADGPDAVLRGSTVPARATPVREDPDDRRSRAIGVDLVVTGADSTQHLGTVRGCIPRIAAVYGVSDDAVTVHATGNHRRSRVRILHQWYVEERAAARESRIADVHEHTGGQLVTSGPDAGTHHLMTAADDGRSVKGRLWAPSRGVFDYDFSGVKGSGKSNAVMVVLSSLLSSGVVVMDLIDLKGGASLGMWRPAAFRFGRTLADAHLALDRALAVMYARLDVMSTMQRTDDDGQPEFINGEPWLGVENVDPHPGWPVYLLVVDEFPRLVRDKTAEAKLVELVDLSRAADVALMVIHQSAARGEGWGEKTGLRTNITKSGNAIAFRNDQNAGYKTVGRGVALDQIRPGTPGAGFVSSPCEPVETLGRFPFMSPDAIKDAVRAARPGQLEPAALAAVERVEAEHAARKAADEARAAAAAGGAASGRVGSVTPVDDLTDAERAIAAAFGGPGRAMRTGEILTAANLPSSTFHAAKDGTDKRPGLVARGLLVSQGHGQWVATAALYERQAV